MDKLKEIVKKLKGRTVKDIVINDVMKAMDITFDNNDYINIVAGNDYIDIICGNDNGFINYTYEVKGDI